MDPSSFVPAFHTGFIAGLIVSILMMIGLLEAARYGRNGGDDDE